MPDISETDMNVGFIGLGIMGGPMAGHLIAGGHSLALKTRRQVPENLVEAEGTGDRAADFGRAVEACCPRCNRQKHCCGHRRDQHRQELRGTKVCAIQFRQRNDRLRRAAHADRVTE